VMVRITVKEGCWVVMEQKIHLRTQAASSVASDALPSFDGLMRERTKPRRDVARSRGSPLWTPSKAEPRRRKKNWLSSSSVEGNLVQQITEISRDVTA
jgi:hypothetical protein